MGHPKGIQGLTERIYTGFYECYSRRQAGQNSHKQLLKKASVPRCKSHQEKHDPHKMRLKHGNKSGKKVTTKLRSSPSYPDLLEGVLKKHWDQLEAIEQELRADDIHEMRLMNEVVLVYAKERPPVTRAGMNQLEKILSRQGERLLSDQEYRVEV
ncbi:hypothetical protein PInf_003321 [Phytophthora infestans]|nr:hypothetical protein PInf_003321 [Phytophthora infestans]